MPKGYFGGSRGFSVPETPSVAAVSMDPTASEVSRTITLIGTPDPLVSIVPTRIPFVNIGDEFSGNLLTPQGDGSLLVNADIKLFIMTGMALPRYASNANVVLGVGVGDPNVLPTFPGTSTDTLPLGTYISRFRHAQRGEGTSRRVTLQLPYFLVGKTNAIGARAGDKIFPLMWTLESMNTDIVLDDFIFAVEAVAA